MHRFRAMNMQSITETEQKILQLLLKNSRVNVAALAEALGKNRNWITHSIRRLVRDRLLLAYVTILNPGIVYAERSTILLVKTNPRELGISRALLNVPGLESLDGVSGEYSLLGLFRFRGAGAFEQFLDVIDNTIARSGSNTYKLVQVLTTYKTHGFLAEPSDSVNHHLSPTDWELLRVLRRQLPSEEHPFFLSQYEIGQQMRRVLSQPAVSKAMRRLEASGAILGYSINLNFGYIGLPIKFFLQIKPAPGTIAETAHDVATMDEVWDLHRTSESFSLFATVRTRDVNHYNQFLRRLYENKNILDTNSQISLEEWFVPVRNT